MSCGCALGKRTLDKKENKVNSSILQDSRRDVSSLLAITLIRPQRDLWLSPYPPHTPSDMYTDSSFFLTMCGVGVRFFMLVRCDGNPGAALGTTPNIKHIVMGRCYTYITLVNPGLRYDCEDVWRRFEEAVVSQSPCNVTVEDYHQMFMALAQTPPSPCDRFLFWSKTRRVVQSYAAALGGLWTLEDSVAGYMFNDLIWCRQEEESGFDFSSCPEWSTCQHHPVHSLWWRASKLFAEMACGNITVLLNGSIINAFNRKSMFGSVELDSLNPCTVNFVNIKVVTNPEGPSVESCSQGSIVKLLQILQSRGFRWTCTENDQTLMMLQWIQDPKQKCCQTGARHLLLGGRSLP